MSIIAGIDLGTSTSEIAVLKDGKPYVIPNHLGEYITPSIVGISEDGRIIVGKEAKDQLLIRPEHTVMEVKRLMGSNEKITMGGKEYTPQQISSFILKYLVDCVSEHLGEKIERAVISVPAYFSDTQRRATVEAGLLAGLKVERIINEPTAASLDYGIEHMKDCKNILVYDLGGGTLDVTVLELFEGIIDVKASSGNNKLGGKDFDKAVMDYLLDRFNEKHETNFKFETLEPRASMRLKETAEECKISLSNQDEYEVIMPFFTTVNGQPVSLEEKVTVDTFQSLIQDMVDSTFNQISIALKDAKLTKQDIDHILLVGGSTRIPYVKSFIEKSMGKAADLILDPDLAVVRGAAIQAGILNNELTSENDILITDVCPYTLGTSVLDFIGGIPVIDVFDVIIPRNTTIPTVRKKIYGTVVDNQDTVRINVYQGEYKKASMNNHLGEFLLKGIPPAPALEEKIEISFSYDVNGILNVEGTIVSTGKKASVSIETTGLSMVKEIDVSRWKEAPNSKRFRAIIRKAERMLDNEEAGELTLELEMMVRKIKEALVNTESLEVLEELKDELTDLLYEISE
ncbi:MAG: Hsp70 family protein [Clostridiaceae bacterium]|nr:Hsp70 family protein [Clostridiaceae bacterium]